MGRAIEQILADTPTQKNLNPYLFVGNETSNIFAISAANIENIEPEVMADVDVWIDFTSSHGLVALLKATEKFKTPIVSGSTGLSDQDFKKIKTSAKSRALFWASNMSPGLWAFRQAMKAMSNISNFDFALEEIHHTQKKDRPSGTAKTLHTDLEKITNKKIEIPKSFRLGGVFGVHTLYAASANEVITMQHQALNRSVFAEGALMASLWLAPKKAGFYSMDDMFLKSQQLTLK